MKNSNEAFESTKAFIENMQQTAKLILDKLIPDDAEIILLDYPNTTNVGDSLIWLGEIAYLKSRGLKIKYVCDSRNYDYQKLKQVINDHSIVLMHGGGNFGTVWEEIHTFRLKVINELKSVPIIQLPQTIHFDSEDKVNEINQAITKHGQYTLLARGQFSYSFAKSNFNAPVYLCPDMAFFIGAIKHQSANNGFVAVARTDCETSGALNFALKTLKEEQEINITDWLDPSLAERLIHRIEMHTVGLRRLIDPHNMLLLKLWNLLSTLRLKRGVAILGTATSVVTDRLHVHILSILLNKPHIMVDNNYGKLKRFYETWTYRCALVKYAAKSNDAVGLVREFSSVSLMQK